MSTIVPRPPISRPQTPERATTAAGRAPTLPNSPGSPRRPPVQHTVSDARLPASPGARRAPAAGVIRTTPALVSTAPTAGALANQKRLDVFRHLSQPMEHWGDAARQQLAPLFNLLGHPEGLKTYFIELESAGTYVNCHTKADYEAFVPPDKTRGVEPPAKVAEHRDLAAAVRAVLNKDAPPSSAQRPLLPAKQPQPTLSNHQISVWMHKAAALKLRDTHNPALGGHVVQGGTRLCLQPDSNTVELSASGLYNYSAPSPEAVARLARFYANVLVDGAQGGPPLRCTVAELLPKASSADQQAHPALVALKDAINAELDRAKFPSGP